MFAYARHRAALRRKRQQLAAEEEKTRTPSMRGMTFAAGQQALAPKPEQTAGSAGQAAPMIGTWPTPERGGRPSPAIGTWPTPERGGRPSPAIGTWPTPERGVTGLGARPGGRVLGPDSGRPQVGREPAPAPGVMTPRPNASATSSRAGAPMSPTLDRRAAGPMAARRASAPQPGAAPGASGAVEDPALMMTLLREQAQERGGDSADTDAVAEARERELLMAKLVELRKRYETFKQKIEAIDEEIRHLSILASVIGAMTFGLGAIPYIKQIQSLNAEKITTFAKIAKVTAQIYAVEQQLLA